jgi:uncharacterized integral membrane protein
MSEPETESAPLVDTSAEQPPSPDAKLEVNAASTERFFAGTGLFWGLIVGVLLATAVVILVAQNTGSISVAFLGWDFSTSLIVIVLVTLLVGVVLDELFGLVYRRRRRRVMNDRERLARSGPGV